MNVATPSEPGSLPAGAVALLEAFERSRPGVRVWVRRTGSDACLYPADGGGGRAELLEGAGYLRKLAAGGDAEYELEVAGGVGVADVDFLAEALTQVLRYEREARLTARELSERYEEINLLYLISEILGSVLSLPTAANWILAEVAEVMQARRASLWVYDPAIRQLRLAAAVGEEGLAGPIPIDDPNSVTAWVFRERQALNLERGDAFPRRGARLEPRPRGREAYLSAPISYTPPEGGARTVGVITLVGRTTGTSFSASDTRLLSAIASQIGAALETHRLVEESLRQERLIRELELAHDLQLKLLPDASRLGGPAEVAARCVPAESVGGDFYHLFRLSGERLGVMIGDVSSHGFSAALIMAMLMSAAAIYAQEAAPPGEVLLRVHHALLDELETTEMYLTLFYGILDPGQGTLVYANAGHPHAFVVGGDGSVVRLGATSPPLGMVSFGEYGESVVDWRRGQDLLFLFTDGLSDAFATEGCGGGEAVIVSEVVRLRDRPLQEILSHLFAVAERARLAIPPDDRTAVLVRG